MATERQEGVDWRREIKFGRSIAEFEALARMGRTTIPTALKEAVEKARANGETVLKSTDVDFDGF